MRCSAASPALTSNCQLYTNFSSILKLCIPKIKSIELVPHAFRPSLDTNIHAYRDAVLEIGEFCAYEGHLAIPIDTVAPLLSYLCPLFATTKLMHREEAFEYSYCIVLLCCDNTQVWNFRKEYLLTLASASASELYYREMDLLDVLVRSKKGCNSATVWYHRRWLHCNMLTTLAQELNPIPDLIDSTSTNCNTNCNTNTNTNTNTNINTNTNTNTNMGHEGVRWWSLYSREHAAISAAQTLHPRNYHALTYRWFLFQTVAPHFLSSVASDSVADCNAKFWATELALIEQPQFSDSGLHNYAFHVLLYLSSLLDISLQLPPQISTPQRFSDYIVSLLNNNKVSIVAFGTGNTALWYYRSMLARIYTVVYTSKNINTQKLVHFLQAEEEWISPHGLSLGTDTSTRTRTRTDIGTDLVPSRASKSYLSRLFDQYHLLNV